MDEGIAPTTIMPRTVHAYNGHSSLKKRDKCPVQFGTKRRDKDDRDSYNTRMLTPPVRAREAQPLPTREDLLRAQPYFAVLDDADLGYLAERLVVRHYARGEVVFGEGEPCEGLHIVVEGQVRIYKLSPEGREQVLRYCGARQSFNEVAVFDGGPNPAHVSAVSACTLWIVPRQLIFDLVRARPAMAIAIIQNLGSQMRHLVGLVEDLSLRQVSARVAKLLLEVTCGPQSATHLTQQEMAAQLGTVREMVARSLKQLEARGLIRVDHGNVRILDRANLERMI